MSVTKSPLFLLRQRTRLAYNLCREALVKHNNDVDRAEVWLQAEAMRLGLQKASKLQSRSAKEGLIGLAVHSNRRAAAMIELNCETDFVAKNITFQTFAQELTKKVVAKLEEQYPAEASKQGDRLINKFFLASQELKLFDGDLVPIVSKLGENVRLGRAALLTSSDPTVGIYGDVHGSSMKQAEGDRGSAYQVQAGKFGSLVGLQFLDGRISRLVEDNSLRIGTRLCKHVIGFDPSYIELPLEIREKLLEAKRAKEAEESEIAEALRGTNQKQSMASERDMNEIEVPYIEEPPSMVDQTLIMDPDNQKVGAFCENLQIKIVDINRFECGQSQD